MNITHKAALVSAFMKARLFRARKPVIVNWAITYRCNRSCEYCGVADKQLNELSTSQVLVAINEMFDSGARKIHFTGGEPLLREDIHVAVGHCRKKKINVSMNSNGALVPQRIKDLIGLDLLSLSLDGPEEIHDSIRGAGSYREVMEAIKCAGENNIKIRLATVLSKLNLGSIDFILEKAKELNTVVIFQPAQKSLLETKKVNPIAPPVDEYRDAIAGLIKEKINNKFIGNSLSGLKHLYHWPSLKKISCVNGLIVCRVEPDGEIYGCADFKKENQGIKIQEFGFREAFRRLIPLTCDECWCASYVELNCLFSGKLDSIINAKKLA